jgi:zinc protease
MRRLMLTLLCALAVLWTPTIAQTQATIRYVTSTGVRAIIRPEPETGLVAVAVAVDTSEADRTARPGTADLVAQCLFGANANMSAEGVAREVYLAGGNIATLRLPDCIIIRCVTAPSALRDAIWVIAQALKGARFDAETVRRAAESLSTDSLREAGSPLDVASNALAARLFVGDPYGRPRFSAATAPRTVALADLERFYATAFVPQSTVVCIVGDIEAADARDSLDNQLVDYDRRPPRRRPVYDEAESREPTSELSPLLGPQSLSVRTDARTSAVAVGLRTPGRTSRDSAACAVLAAIVGGGKASRLFRAARDARGIGYIVGAEAQLWRRAGMIVGFAERDAVRAAQAGDSLARLVADVMEGVVAHPPGDEEMERARRFVIGEFRRSTERNVDLAQALAETELLDGDWRGFESYTERIAAVTSEEVVQLARKLLPDRVVVRVNEPDAK